MREILNTRFKLLFVFTLLISCASDLFSSHLMGGELTYTWLGAKKYEITAKMYRDCRGIALDSPLISVFSNDGKTRVVVTNYKRVSIEDITPVCKGKGPCSPANQTIITEGVEVHVFKAIIDFSSAPYDVFVKNNICQVYFGLEQCCRNGAITTISPGNFYVESMLDLCNSGFSNSSPQFYTSVDMFLVCNQPFKTNLGAIDNNDFDSLAFALVPPMNAHGSSESYSGGFSAGIPMTPYCPPNPGVLNCKPVPTARPPRGFYFDPQTGNIAFTPTKCDEVGVLSVKTSEYRKDSTGKWQLIGFVIRDLQAIIKSNPLYYNQVPEVKVSTLYTFKTGKRQCIDIETVDTVAAGYSSSNRGDTTSIRVLNMPPGADFKYLDSNASGKTGRFCWTIHDSVYLNIQGFVKLIPIALEIRDNYCPGPGVVRQTFYIRASAPDSSGLLEIETFEDKDKNGQKNNGEKNTKARLKIKDPTLTTYALQTDEGGLFSDSLGKGNYTIGIAPHPYILPTQPDTLLKINFASKHSLQLGVIRKPGIYGRIYEDRNGNCKFDNTEFAVPGVKVTTDSSLYTGITDKDGIYYINAPAGSYNLKCLYQPFDMAIKCPSNNTRTVTVVSGNIYDDNDFGIAKNLNYTDLSVYVNTGRLRRGEDAILNLYCKNKGNKTLYNVMVYLPVDSGIILRDGKDTLSTGGSVAVISIDSITSGAQKMYGFEFYVSPSLFKANDKICFSAKTDSVTTSADSVKQNNTSSSCAIVNAPYDPNEKVVAGNVVKTPLDQSISYTIHFQNTGTDTAKRVMVSDTINTQYLDIARFEMNWSDAPYETIIDGNIIYFIFDQIRLPHLSIAGDKSISGFNFSLGLKSKLPDEQSFSNRASIYFDFEDPIHTKPAITKINSPVSISRLAKYSLCGTSENIIYFNSNIQPEKNNMFILEMSDAQGNFTSPTTIAGTISSESSDSIIFTPPVHTYGNFKLRIKTTAPESVSIPGSGITDFLALSRPDFTVTTNLARSKICAGDSLRISVSTNTYDYKILKNNIELSGFGQAKTYVLLPAKTDQYAIVARDNANSCTDTSYIYMEVIDKPVVETFITNRKSQYCAGESITLNASGAKLYTYYNHSIPLGNQSTQTSINLSLLGNSVYKVLGVDPYGCSNTSDTMMVKVNPLPAKPVVNHDKNTLTANSTGNIEWFKDGLSLGLKDSIFNAKSGIYKAIVTNAEGCSASSDNYSHTNTAIESNTLKPFKVYPNPATNILSIENPGNAYYTVNLYDLSGKLVMTGTFDHENASLYVNTLSAGMYILKTNDANGVNKVVLVSINN